MSKKISGDLSIHFSDDICIFGKMLLELQAYGPLNYLNFETSEIELTGSSIRGFFCLSLFKRVWYWSRFALSKNISSSNSIASFVSIGGVSSRVVAKDPVAPLCKLRPDWLDFGRGGIFAPKNV